MIDWPAILKAYNRDYNVDYKSRAELLQILYAEHRSGTKVGKILCVCNQSVISAMHEDNLEVLPKGHRHPSPLEKKLMDLGDVSDLTFDQISRKIGWSKDYGYILLRRHHTKFKGQNTKENKNAADKTEL